MNASFSMKSQKKQTARWCHNHYRYQETSYDVQRSINIESCLLWHTERFRFQTGRQITRRGKNTKSQREKARKNSTPTNNQWFLCFFPLLHFLRFFFLFSGNIGHHTKAKHTQEPHNFSASFIITFFSFIPPLFFLSANDDFLRSFCVSCKTYKVEIENGKNPGSDSTVMSLIRSQRFSIRSTLSDDIISARGPSQMLSVNYPHCRKNRKIDKDLAWRKEKIYFWWSSVSEHTHIHTNIFGFLKLYQSLKESSRKKEKPFPNWQQ